MPSFAGIDIGNNNCKIALRDGGAMRLVSCRMPENMVNASEVVSPDTMAAFLRSVRRSQHVRSRRCVLVLAGSQAFFRHVTLPAMTVSELKLNLPYEFRDFIVGDPGDYVYDYAVDQIVADATGKPQKLEVFAAAAPRKLVESYDAMLRKSGFKLEAVVPAPMAYARLLSAHVAANPIDVDRDVVLVDIGHADVTVVLFHGAQYEASKTIDFGCDEFDFIIAEMKGIDPYTASSYKYANFEEVLDAPECRALCERFAIEVSKVVNFYNFNNPDRDIEQLYFLGGGAQIPQLTQAISEAVSVPAQDIDFLLPSEAKGQANGPVCALAVAGVLEGEAM